MADVQAFIKKHHYSHTHPGGVTHSFRLDVDNKLSGACIFGQVAGNPKALCILDGHDDPLKYAELMRLVLLDEVPKNSESQFVGWCLRWLKKNTDLLACISFADPKHGHSGIIYKASNWIYCGLQKTDRPRLIIDGIELHSRMAYNRYGTSSVKQLKELLNLNITTEPREPKHRYVYVLRPELSGLLKKRLFNNVH